MLGLGDSKGEGIDQLRTALLFNRTQEGGKGWAGGPGSVSVIATLLIPPPQAAQEGGLTRGVCQRRRKAHSWCLYTTTVLLPVCEFTMKLSGIL